MLLNLVFFVPRKTTKAVERGADPNYIGPEGFAAIHLAAGLDGAAGMQLLKLMLRYNGDPNLKSSDSETALHIAVMWNRENATRLLLACGADPTIRNSDGLTAFDLAENTSDHELKCLDLLRNSLNDSSESDFSPNERTVLFNPTSNYRHGSKNNKLRESLMSPKRKSTEFGDVVDGESSYRMQQSIGLKEKQTQTLYKKVPSPSYFQSPYNPIWAGMPGFEGHQPGEMKMYPNFNQMQHPDQPSTLNTGRDSFFDLSLPSHRHSLIKEAKSFEHQNKSCQSDSQESLDTAFTWDSDIDSSTSYFSLPKESLRGFITELKDGEEKCMLHKGISGEASLIIGTDFESRISLGEIPISLIKNANESILSEQFRRSSGRRSAEKMFLRRAKLVNMQSGKKSRKSQDSWTGTNGASVSSPNGYMPERPRFFRAPFPLINMPARHFQNGFTEEACPRDSEVGHSPEKPKMVDKTTQKSFESSRVNGGSATNDLKVEGARTEKTTNSSRSKQARASPDQRATFLQQHTAIQSSLSSIPPVTGTGSAETNTRTPTTDETLSQPGNEETEIEFPIMHTFGSPRNLYAEGTPVAPNMTRSLFDQSIFGGNMTNGVIPDGEIFKFGFEEPVNETKDSSQGKGTKRVSSIQRKIDVLDSNQADVFPTDVESAAGESDGNSSGYNGDTSQQNSPDDVASVSQPMFDLRNSPSVTSRSKRRKDMMDERSGKNLEEASTTDTDSREFAEADRPDGTKADLPASPRKRLNGVTSSSDETNRATTGKTEKDIVEKRPNLTRSPGFRVRQKVDHTFEDRTELKSPLLPEELKSYHKAQLNKPTRARKKWEHKYDCSCELCMTRKGHTSISPSLPNCDHDQCHECEEGDFDEVSVEYDWKDVSLLESTNGEQSIVVPKDIQALNVEELKQRLIKAEEKPGPITNNTKNIYMKHLARVEAGVVTKGKVGCLSWM